MRTSLANKHHQALFPEEYDFCYDSIAEANDRKKGINPMNREYQLVVNSRCQQRGFDEFDVESEKVEAVPSQRGRGPFPLTKRITFEK